MPLEGSDIVWYLSSAGASEGGAKSATPVTDNVDENYFEDVSDVSRIAGGEELRKIFASNDDGVDSFLDHSIWILLAPASSECELGLGVDSADDADPDAGALTDFSAPAKVALVSDGADTRTVRIRGKNGSGDPITEDVVLTGASEVLSVATFSSLYNGAADAVSGSRTITIKQGAGGTVRGQIPIGLIVCFRWVAGATSKSLGIHLPDLVTGSAEPIWTRLTWDPDATPASTRVKLRAQTL
jgi:hypothetical protein